jgi:hypothetical protein
MTTSTTNAARTDSAPTLTFSATELARFSNAAFTGYRSLSQEDCTTNPVCGPSREVLCPTTTF